MMDERERYRQTGLCGKTCGSSWYPMIHRCGQSAGGVRKEGRKSVLSRYQRRCHHISNIQAWPNCNLPISESKNSNSPPSRFVWFPVRVSVNLQAQLWSISTAVASGGGLTHAGQTYRLYAGKSAALWAWGRSHGLWEWKASAVSECWKRCHKWARVQWTSQRNTVVAWRCVMPRRKPVPMTSIVFCLLSTHCPVV